MYSTWGHADDKANPYPFLDSLSDVGLSIDDEAVSAGPFGVQIVDLNSAIVSTDLMQAAEKVKGTEEFREVVCEMLQDPELCLEAYAFLNQLYPEHSLKIAQGPFHCAVPREDTGIPIKLLSGSESILIQMNIRSFGDTCRSYWRRKLKVRSELEKTLDRTRPGWRKKLEDEMEKERKQ